MTDIDPMGVLTPEEYSATIASGRKAGRKIRDNPPKRKAPETLAELRQTAHMKAYIMGALKALDDKSDTVVAFPEGGEGR